MKTLALLIALIPWMPALGGQLLGTVTEQGSGVAGAEVMILEPSGVTLDQTITNRKGEFRFQLTPGHYGLRVFLGEYAPLRRDNLEIGDQDVHLTLEMTPAAFVDDAPAYNGDCD